MSGQGQFLLGSGDPRAANETISTNVPAGQTGSSSVDQFVFTGDYLFFRMNAVVTNTQELSNVYGYTDVQFGDDWSLKANKTVAATKQVPFMPDQYEQHAFKQQRIFIKSITASPNAQASFNITFRVTPAENESVIGAIAKAQLDGWVPDDASFLEQKRSLYSNTFTIKCTNSAITGAPPTPGPGPNVGTPFVKDATVQADIGSDGTVKDASNSLPLVFTGVGIEGFEYVMGGDFFGMDRKLKNGVKITPWSPTDGGQVQVQIKDLKSGAVSPVATIRIGSTSRPAPLGGSAPQPDNFNQQQPVGASQRTDDNAYNFKSQLISWSDDRVISCTGIQGAQGGDVAFQWQQATDKSGYLVGKVPAKRVQNGTNKDGTPAQQATVQTNLEFSVTLGMNMRSGSGIDNHTDEVQLKFSIIDLDGKPPANPGGNIQPGTNTSNLTDFRFLESATIRIPVVKASTQPQPASATPQDPNTPTPAQPATSPGYTIQPPYMLKTTSPNNLNVKFEVTNVKYPGIWQHQAGQVDPNTGQTITGVPDPNTGQPIPIKGTYGVQISSGGMLSGTVPDAAVTADNKSLQTDPNQQVAITVKATYSFTQQGANNQVDEKGNAVPVNEVAGPYTFYLFFVDLVALQQQQGQPPPASIDQQNAAAGQAAAAIQPVVNDPTVYTATQNPSDPSDIGENGNMLLKGPNPDQGGWWSMETKEASFNDISMKVPRFQPSEDANAPIQSHAASWYMKQRQGLVVEDNQNWQKEEASYKVHLDKIGDFQSDANTPWTQLAHQPFHHWSPLPPTAHFAEAGWEVDKEQLRLENLAMRTFATQEAKAQARADKALLKRELKQEEKRMRDENRKRKLSDMVDPRIGYYYNHGKSHPFASSTPNFNSTNAALPPVIPAAPNTPFIQNFMPTTNTWQQSMDEETRAKRAQMLHDRYIRHPLFR